MTRDNLTTVKRLLWNTVGIISVVLGVVGIVLPLLPTTPFLLLASACFFRGSPAFHHWLQTHPKLGPIITDWEQERRVTKSVKQKGAVFIVLSFSLSIFVVNGVWLKVMLFTLFLLIFTFFLRIPVKPPVADQHENH
ncbi:YbaN family protein [Vibrio sp. SCSIO 43140]|uniref:YbaN family protein n=1 Tax=Vibrio sp. SCSIO 43140 TaxID=2819100 RepID=UPI002184CE18|nr:YbaN family protein [Vibrio sp. SCSIO 43140]USD61420.1 YbaN family protein [Vibrio sp. SCSIO 43140]